MASRPDLAALEIAKRSDTAKAVGLLPKRRVVERTFTWLNRQRRLAETVAETVTSAAIWLYVAGLRVMS